MAENVIIVIPYRDRAPQLAALLPTLLKRNVNRIIVAEQVAGASFNRGAMKNVGFILSRPEDESTVYFHDVDIIPGDQTVVYPMTKSKRAIHLYGHTHCLGGVVGMRAFDFTEVDGFCNNMWHWGGEDTALEKAWLHQGYSIDRAWRTPRFGNTRAFAELDSMGKPMTGQAAQRLFTNSLRQKISERDGRFKNDQQTSCHGLQPGLRALRFSVVTDRSYPDPRVQHVVCQLFK